MYSVNNLPKIQKILGNINEIINPEYTINGIKYRKFNNFYKSIGQHSRYYFNNFKHIDLYSLFDDHIDMNDLTKLKIKKYSRNIVKNYSNVLSEENIPPNSMIYNLIVSLTIKKIIEILKMDINDPIFGSENIIDINQRYFNKIQLFLFLYCGRRRYLIACISTPSNTNIRYEYNRYGSFVLYDREDPLIPHPLSMKRFDNNFDRLFYNFSRLYDLSINPSYRGYDYRNIVKSNPYKIEVLFFSKELDDNINTDVYLRININRTNFIKINDLYTRSNNPINIYDYFINIRKIHKNILKKKKNNSEYLETEEYKNHELIMDFYKFTQLGNYVNEFSYHLNILNLSLINLDKIYNKLNGRNNINKINRINVINRVTEINKMKYYILLFYYIVILLMPFNLGTASIAEIVLYSLWEYYIRNEIKINDNVMLDVEALMTPFDIFYENCLNNNNEIINGINYTPYLFESSI
jgi:hypothetical protein